MQASAAAALREAQRLGERTALSQRDRQRAVERVTGARRVHRRDRERRHVDATARTIRQRAAGAEREHGRAGAPRAHDGRGRAGSVEVGDLALPPGRAASLSFGVT